MAGSNPLLLTLRDSFVALKSRIKKAEEISESPERSCHSFSHPYTFLLLSHIHPTSVLTSEATRNKPAAPQDFPSHHQGQQQPPAELDLTQFTFTAV